MESSRRRAVAVIAALALVPVLISCTTRPVPTGDDEIRVLDDAEQADLVLYVSNQSFEHDRVTISVRIDDVLVVEQAFAVEGQHNWVEFPIDLPPGPHAVTATSGTGVDLEETVTIPEGEKRWVVLDYWYYPDRGDGSDVVDPSFTFTAHEEPVGFD